jgi:sec-independent protein translocase protein TatA
MIGTSELILILIAALFLFGPTKLPELARSMGKAVGEFKKAQMETEYDLKRLDSDKPPNERDAKIHNLAIEMGLDAQNKTTEQLVEEIRLKVKSGEALPIRKASI